jgi:hypothetical protein
MPPKLVPKKLLRSRLSPLSSEATVYCWSSGGCARRSEGSSRTFKERAAATASNAAAGIAAWRFSPSGIVYVGAKRGSRMAGRRHY